MPLGAGTILPAEDGSAVRAVSSRALKNQGYEVIEASNGREALDTVRAMSVGAIDLLITDVVMPILGGRELAAEFEKLQPSAKVLYVSGYAERNVIDIAEGSIDSKTSFMQKPFSPIDLAIKVSDLLTERRHGVSA